MIKNLLYQAAQRENLNYLGSLLLLLASIMLAPQSSEATHNRAGEITFKHIDGYTYEITLNTYTDFTSPPNREELEIFWGDGTSTEVKRDNIENNIGQDNKFPIDKNTYTHRHTYAGPGTYTIRMEDKNRVAKVVNMDNSVNTSFYVETKLHIFPGSSWINNSPKLLQPPIDYASTGEVFVHNPNAYDQDGDSLAFSLVPPKQAHQKTVNGYYQPYAKNEFSIDKNTGQLVWDVPHQDSTGIYNIAIKIEEFRKSNGNVEKIGEVIRDMQIIVRPGKNRPPKIDPLNDTCLLAGQEISFQTTVNAEDPDSQDDVTLTATGGPFEVNTQSAKFPGPVTSQKQVDANFTWKTSCKNIRKRPYQVVFKAKDDHNRTPLADLEPIQIKVIGPPPKNPSIEPEPKGIQLDWDLPECENVLGYRIYRRVDTSNWQPDHCETGVPGYTGFKQIAELVGKDKNAYFDETVAPGAVYCYRITGVYQKEGTFEVAEGKASTEVCARLKKDLPVITHVDVQRTDDNNGKIFMDWTKPVELDTLTYEPPYKYQVVRSTGLQGDEDQAQVVKTIQDISSFKALERQSADTVLYDSNLNTQEQPYTYQIKFYGHDNGEEILIGSSRFNSSPYLNIDPTHQTLVLSVKTNVLWNNNRYVVYKKDTLSGAYNVLDTVETPEYVDKNLTNGKTYCYYFQTIGQFSAPDFPAPIINNSQKACDYPRDTIPPCSPELESVKNCSNTETTSSGIRKENRLKWDYDFTNKDCDKDVVKYRIYYRSHKGKEFRPINTLPVNKGTKYIDDRDALEYSVAGCYAVTAIDSYDNESELSNTICVDNCPNYELPNVFTPNEDGKNDVFRAFPDWRFVKEIKLEVYNRWGQVVYETKDPNFKWDGTNQSNGQPASAGTYYYNLTTYELYLDKTVAKTQEGTITIIR